MNLLKLLLLLVVCAVSTAQNLHTSCNTIPTDIPASRSNRLHHSCESNQNPYFAIETYKEFYCVFYSSIVTSLFGAETKFEIKLKGEWDFEQVFHSDHSS